MTINVPDAVKAVLFWVGLVLLLIVMEIGSLALVSLFR
jgi:hypothetical protein